MSGLFHEILIEGEPMDIKVNQVQQVNQPTPKPSVQETDGSFKFTLVSHIEDQNLQARDRKSTRLNSSHL